MSVTTVVRKAEAWTQPHLQDPVDSLWIADHLTPAQAEEFGVDLFKRWLTG